MPNRGLFITLEGGEGSGKTTQARRLKQALEETGREVIMTREPGGTPEGETLRGLLAQSGKGDWTPIAECLILFAARSMHVEKVINPALARGAIVVCDRFTDSTRAYQGYGHGLSLERIEALNQATLGDMRPDITFIFDLPVEIGLKRALSRMTGGPEQEDRFEKLDLGFHQRMRQGFLTIAANEPERCRIIDATQSQDAITDAVLPHLQWMTSLHA